MKAVLLDDFVFVINIEQFCFLNNTKEKAANKAAFVISYKSSEHLRMGFQV